jgi:hypothetical protein
MAHEEKIDPINAVIKHYFEKNKDVDKIPAKDLMPDFIKAGIFEKDHRSGLPIRAVLRELDKNNQLNKIPFVLPERKAKNTNWYLGRVNHII